MEERFIVDVDNSYTSQTAYEVGGVLLFPEFLPQSNQVVTLTPSIKTTSQYPLAINPEKQLESKHQIHLSNINRTVIRQLPDVSQNTILPVITVQATDQMVQEILPHSTEKTNYNDNKFPNLKQCNRHVDKEQWEEMVYPESSTSADDHEAVEAPNIPLTVRLCSGENKLPDEDATNTEDDGDNIQPIFDDEPDPENSTCSSKDMTNRCYMCFKKFRQKKNMYAHIRKIHSSQPMIQGGIICPLCKMHALRHEHLRYHLKTLHNVKITKEDKQFNTIEEFKDWKELVEKETLSYYISKSSAKLLAQSQTKTYYKCHRSGLSLAKRNGKKQNSRKIEATCPAAIEVIENASGIQVTFWSTHVGHNMLSLDERGRVEDLLTSGLAWDQVLNEMQHESKKKSEHPAIAKQPKHVSVDKQIKRPGRKAKVPSQSQLIKKAHIFLNVLETHEVIASYRSLISSMIDNLTSIVQRRVVDVTQEGDQRKRKNVTENVYVNSPNSTGFNTFENELYMKKRKKTGLK